MTIQSEINIISRKEMKGGSITAFEVEPPFSVPEQTRFGVDPGTVNSALAIIHPSSKVIYLYQIKTKRQNKALDRMLLIQNKLMICIEYFGKNPLAIIEGAAFMRSNYRQVELAEIRASCALWFHRMGVDVEIIPPNSIRKSSFGSAKVKNPWYNIDGNLAAALGAAYYDTKDSL